MLDDANPGYFIDFKKDLESDADVKDRKMAEKKEKVLSSKPTRKFSFKRLWDVIKSASNSFIDDKLMKLSGALSFYMIFSMGPLLLIIITMCSIFFGRAAVEGKIYAQLEGFIGHDTAIQLQQIIQHAAISGKTTVATIIGVAFLIIGASSVFAEMQDSINMIWGLKPKPKSGWVAFLKNRLLSFSIIVSLAFLLLVSLGFSALVEIFGNHLKSAFPGISIIVVYVINLCMTVGITTFIFAVIFKVLPDAKIKWRDVSIGALTTTILFLLGKFAISFYISKSNVGSTYGAAGSLIILLLWVYYSSMILYYGAEFTKFYAVEFGDQIKPMDYAVTVRMVEEEKGKMSIQQKEKTKTKT
jgi:membrane protein